MERISRIRPSGRGRSASTRSGGRSGAVPLSRTRIARAFGTDVSCCCQPRRSPRVSRRTWAFCISSIRTSIDGQTGQHSSRGSNCASNWLTRSMPWTLSSSHCYPTRSADVAALIPADPQFSLLAGRVSELLTPTGELRDGSRSRRTGDARRSAPGPHQRDLPPPPSDDQAPPVPGSRGGR